jgi:hypothetical protein
MTGSSRVMLILAKICRIAFVVPSKKEKDSENEIRLPQKLKLYQRPRPELC